MRLDDEELDRLIWLEEQRQLERVSPKLEAFRRPCRIKIARGGRGAGAKSWGVGSLNIQDMQDRPLRLVCLREVQKSLEESVWSLMRDTIVRLRYNNWDITKEYIRNISNGSYMIFRGIKDLRAANQIKSLEAYDRCWMEEAATISDESLSIIFPTIRKEGSEVWITYNPETEDDPVTTRVWNSDRQDIIRVDLLPGAVDNPWWTTTLQAEMEADYRRDPDNAEHVWAGQPKKQGDFCVMSRALLKAAMTRQIDPVGQIEIGVDVARFGNDSTQMYKRKGMVVIDHRELRKADTIEVANAVWDFAKQDRNVRIKIDEGYNPGVVDLVKSKGANVLSVGFGNKASDEDKYPNTASEMWFEFPVDEAQIPNDNDLMRELAGRRYDYDKQGRRMVEAKDKYKERNGGKSPDKADALLLCYYVPAHRYVKAGPKGLI